MKGFVLRTTLTASSLFLLAKNYDSPKWANGFEKVLEKRDREIKRKEIEKISQGS
jgi:hypothetical protein